MTAADLLDCLESRKPDLKEGVWDIIEQVCRARDLMEQYEAGEIGKPKHNLTQYAKLTMIDGDALVFLNNYAHTARSSYTDVDGEDPERGFLLQSASLKTESADESDEEIPQRNGEVVFTPNSSTHGSPLDQIHSESKPSKYRKRGTVGTESSSARRSGMRRSSKPSASAVRSTSSIGVRLVQELPYRSPSAMRKPDSQGENMPKEHMTGDCRTNAHTTMNVSKQAPVVSQSLLTKGCEQDYEGQPPAMNMMHMMSYVETCPPPMDMQHWMGMMPNMGPEPPDRVFGFHPHMMARAPESALAYFGQAAQGMDDSLDGGGMLLMDTTQFHDFHDGPQHPLSMSATDLYQQGIAQPVDITSTDYYSVQH